MRNRETELTNLVLFYLGKVKIVLLSVLKEISGLGFVANY